MSDSFTIDAVDVGAQAPAFTLPGTDDNVYSLPADVPLVVVFYRGAW